MIDSVLHWRNPRQFLRGFLVPEELAEGLYMAYLFPISKPLSLLAFCVVLRAS